MSNSGSINYGPVGASFSSSDLVFLIGLAVILFAPRLFGKGIGLGVGSAVGGVVEGVTDAATQALQGAAEQGQTMAKVLLTEIKSQFPGGHVPPGVNSWLAGYGTVDRNLGAKWAHWGGGAKCHPEYDGKRHELAGDKRALETLVYACAMAGITVLPNQGMVNPDGNPNLMNGHVYGRAIDVPSLEIGAALVHSLSSIADNFNFVSMRDGHRYHWDGHAYKVTNTSAQLVKDHKGKHWHIEIPLASGWISSWVVF